jgi:hypothetical protein
MRLEGAGDVRRDPVLQLEHFIELAVEVIGPKMGTALGVDQLTSDAEARAGLAHTTLEDVAHAELAADLTDIDRASLIGEGRAPSDDKQLADAGQG